MKAFQVKRNTASHLSSFLNAALFFFIIILGPTHALGAPYDYGDAPDPTYPTLSSSNGARHSVSRDYYLGTALDPDPDGQPNADATGDNLDGGFDEDGVTFTTPLYPGMTCYITVTASLDGLLDAWIDFNSDGDWADPFEQIFTSITLLSGDNTISFTVPADAERGATTFARFRYSLQGDLQPTGEAAVGEVE
ncbi:MAG: hypothetical protein D3926_00980, partial [Desulfobacteraceae bacterium]